MKYQRTNVIVLIYEVYYKYSDIQPLTTSDRRTITKTHDIDVFTKIENHMQWEDCH